MRILVTGGTGALGSQVVTRLLAKGHDVRVMSRYADATVPDGVEVAQAELRTGDGLVAAVDGVDAIAHCATNPIQNFRETDLEGTRRLLAAAKAARVGNFFYISIVGVDRQPIGGYPYYKVKFEVEELIEWSGVPWTILRATQFHTLALRMLDETGRLPWQTVLKGLRFQLLDAGEAADHVAAAVEAPAAGRLPDIAGPRDESMETIARAYLRHKGSRKPLLKIPINFAARQGLRGRAEPGARRATGGQGDLGGLSEPALVLEPADCGLHLLGRPIRRYRLQLGLPALLLPRVHADPEPLNVLPGGRVAGSRLPVGNDVLDHGP